MDDCSTSTPSVKISRRDGGLSSKTRDLNLERIVQSNWKFEETMA